MDRYDSVDLFFVLTALALHRGVTAERQAKKLRLRRGSRRRANSLADELADDADVSEAFSATEAPHAEVALGRVTSWGFFS